MKDNPEALRRCLAEIRRRCPVEMANVPVSTLWPTISRLVEITIRIADLLAGVDIDQDGSSHGPVDFGCSTAPVQSTPRPPTQWEGFLPVLGAVGGTGSVESTLSTTAGSHPRVSIEVSTELLEDFPQIVRVVLQDLSNLR